MKEDELTVSQLREALDFMRSKLEEGLSPSKSLEHMTVKCAENNTVEANAHLCRDILRLAAEVDNDNEEKARKFRKTFSNMFVAMVIIIAIFSLALFLALRFH
jgi:hypothetical protein